MASVAPLFLTSPRHLVGLDTLRRDFGFHRVLSNGPDVVITMQWLMLPNVAIIEMSSPRLETLVVRGRVRDRYPHAMGIVRAGFFRFANQNGSATAGPGEVLVLGRPDDEHPATYSCGDDSRVIWVLASPAVFADSVPLQVDEPLASPLGDSFAVFLESLVAHAEEKASQQSATTIRAAEDIASYIFSTFSIQGRASALETRPDPLVAALLEIRQHAHEPTTTPSTIARRLAVSLGQLHRLFEAHERTVAEELRMQRTRLALDALRDPRLRTVEIEAVARASGFNSARTMRRAVIEAEGRTPAEIRSRRVPPA